jgi:hypothetical protein
VLPAITHTLHVCLTSRRHTDLAVAILVMLVTVADADKKCAGDILTANLPQLLWMPLADVRI